MPEWPVLYLGERGINGRGVLEQARKECRDRKRWRPLHHGHPPKGRDVPRGSEASGIDKQVIRNRKVHKQVNNND